MVNVMLATAASISAPTGLWAIILNWIEKSVVNYGWVIVLFTLLIKVCLSPLDLLVKFSSKKTTLMQQKLAPQMARINKKYASDPAQLKAQTNELYKREGFNGVASCLVMIINLAVTMTVFFTLFASLRDMSAYKAINQYISLETSYKEAYSANLDAVKADFKTRFTEALESNGGKLYLLVTPDGGDPYIDPKFEGKTYDDFKSILEDASVSGENGDEVVNGLLSNFYGFGTSLTEAQNEFANYYLVYDFADSSKNVQVAELLVASGKVASEPAAVAASETWKEVKDSWLWIGNIWVADNYKSPLPSYNDLKSLANASKTKEYINYVNGIDKELYNAITTSVHNQNSRWNGYFILAVLAGILSFASQYITELMSKTKNKQVNQFVDQANPQGGMMKFMKILLPALMVIFVISSSAGFGIYILVSSLVSIIISVLTSLIVNACYKKKEAAIYVELEKQTEKSLKKYSKRR